MSKSGKSFEIESKWMVARRERWRKRKSDCQRLWVSLGVTDKNILKRDCNDSHTMLWIYFCCCCYWVTKSCPTLCNPMDCSTLGFPVFHCLRVSSNSSPFSWWCHPTISPSATPFSFCLQSLPASGSFPMGQLFSSGGQSIGASASASVLPMNIQGWFPLGLTGLISLQSKELSRVFSNTTVQKHQFFGAQLSLWSNSHIQIDFSNVEFYTLYGMWIKS